MSAAAGLDAGGYRILFDLATGGMGVVQLAHHRAAGGFERLAVVKRIHPHLVAVRDLADTLVDEARLASQIRHPNVVPVDDVLDRDGELLLVQPYVESVTLSALLAAAAAEGEALRPDIVSRILADALAGLDGAHHAVDVRGRPLEIVHRDVSPHNILVGTDGRSRLIDFGIAKAARRVTVTRTGTLTGKIGYMAPEQLRRLPVDARTDVFSAGVVLYEALTGVRPFDGDDEGDTLLSILIGEPDPPSLRVPSLPPAADTVVATALAGDRDARYASAAEMDDALQRALPPAPPREVALAVERLAGPVLAALRERVRACLDAPGTARRRAPRRVIAALALGVALLAVVPLAVLGARARPREEAAAPPAAAAPGHAEGHSLGREPIASAPIASPGPADEPSPGVDAALVAPLPAAPSTTARATRPQSVRRTKDAPAAPSSELHPSPYPRP